MKKSKEICRESQKTPFINKYNWNVIKHPSNIDDWKSFEKNNQTISLNFCILKKNKYTLLIFQNITKSVKNK